MFFFGIGVELKGHLPAEDGDGRLETLGPLGCWMIWALPVGGRGGAKITKGRKFYLFYFFF